MKILASSVIRSTHRGDSHGGLYVIDTTISKTEQVLDWAFEDIRWDLNLGGDRGLRGLIFHNDLLYAAGARHLFIFNKNFELVDQYTHPLLDGTHELAIEDDKIFNISNYYDSILVFDIITKQWLGGFQHQIGRHPIKFDCMLSQSDSMHLDTVSVKDGIVWYAGSTTEYLYGTNWASMETVHPIKLCFRNTHNANFWKDGIVFNRSLESDTIYQVGDTLQQRWPTPVFDKSKLTNSGLPADHARTEYTRGMVLGEDSICIGTSPACVHEFELGRDEPISTTRLTCDIRNSICGMTQYQWD